MTDNADYRLYLESNFKSLHHELSEIKAQTTKTNGTVQRHEQIIASSLPHTVANCPQNGVIQEIRDKLVGEDAVKKEKVARRNDIIKTVGIIIAALGLCGTAYGLIKGGDKLSAGQTKIETKIDNMGEPVIVNKSGKPLDSRMMEVHYFGKKDTVK